MKMRQKKKEKGPTANLTYFWWIPQLDYSSACSELPSEPYYVHAYSLYLVIHFFVCTGHFVRP